MSASSRRTATANDWHRAWRAGSTRKPKAGHGLVLTDQRASANASYMGSAFAKVPVTPYVANFCAAPWPDTQPTLTPRDRSVLVAQISTDGRRRDPAQTRKPNEAALKPALASGRGVRENQWRTAFSVARRGPRGRGVRNRRHEASGQTRRIEIIEEIDEVLWTAAGDRDGPASVIWRRAPRNRRLRSSVHRSLAQQRGGELASAIPTKRASHVPVPANAKFTVVRRRSRLRRQPFQSGTHSLQTPCFQEKLHRRA